MAIKLLVFFILHLKYMICRLASTTSAEIAFDNLIEDPLCTGVLSLAALRVLLVLQCFTAISQSKRLNLSCLSLEFLVFVVSCHIKSGEFSDTCTNLRPFSRCAPAPGVLCLLEDLPVTSRVCEVCEVFSCSQSVLPPAQVSY